MEHTHIGCIGLRIVGCRHWGSGSGSSGDSCKHLLLENSEHLLFEDEEKILLE